MYNRNHSISAVKQAIKSLNTGDTTEVSEFISSRYFNHESQMDPARSKIRGPQEFIDTVVKLRNAISDLHYEIIEIISSNEKVLAIVSVTGKHTGSFFDFIPPSGNRISFQAVHIFTIGDDSKIIEHRAIRDDLALMYQLGVVKSTEPQYDEFLISWKGAK